jgi:hypothetical protein
MNYRLIFHRNYEKCTYVETMATVTENDGLMRLHGVTRSLKMYVDAKT